MLCFKWREKKDVTMLTTITMLFLLKQGKLIGKGRKFLNYFSFLWKSTKWSRKLLIHLFNLVILNANILNKHYGCRKLTQDEYKDYIVKYLVSERLKCYKIPLPAILSKKLGRHSTDEHNSKRQNEHHFISNIPAGRVKKMFCLQLNTRF